MDGWDIHKFQIKLPEEVNLTRRRVSSNCLSKALFSPVSRTRFSRNSSRSGLSWPTCQNGSLKIFFITITPQKNTNHKSTNSITHPGSCIMLAWMGCWKKLDPNFMKSHTEKRRKKDRTLIQWSREKNLKISWSYSCIEELSLETHFGNTVIDDDCLARDLRSILWVWQLAYQV